MTNRIALQLLFTVLALSLPAVFFAQVPIPIKAKIKANQSSPEACADQFAGNVAFSNFVGASNDIWGGTDPDTIYLCSGDKFDLTITGQDLTGDPDMSTPAGTGFGLYQCAPTIAGPNLTAVNADCHYSFGGSYVISTGGTVSGNQTFENTGLLQTQLDAGNPTCVWFAPITYDALVGTTPTYENSGPCVNVNINDNFPVVYLNPIAASNLVNTVGGFDCIGSFTILGGLPEYTNSTGYTIDISLASDPSVKALLLTDPSTILHGKQVRFQVGQAGMYNISISDGKSCSFSQTVDMSACPSVKIDLDNVSGAPGSNVCVAATVGNFSNITGMEFDIHWDPSIVTFDKITSSVLAGINATNTAGILSFVWLSPSFPTGVTIADNDEAFQVCFDIVGAIGTVSPVTIEPNNNGITISNGAGIQHSLDATSQKGSVSVQVAGALDVVLSSTPPTCVGQSNGSIDVMVTSGSDFPVSLSYAHSTGIPMGNITIPNTTTVNIPNLPAGVYTMTFTDNNGVVLVRTIEVAEGFQLGVNLPAVTTQCYGDLMNICPDVFDGNLIPVTDFTGYTFSWNGGNMDMCQNAIPSGFFAVTVTDPNGCSASASGTMKQPAQIQINETLVDPSCKGVDNGSVELQPTGGDISTTGTYEIIWQNPPASSTASLLIQGLSPGVYNVTITDNNNCQVTDSYTLAYQKELVASVTKQDVSCNGLDDGSVLATGTTIGGTAALPYSYTWNPSALMGNNPMNLPPGLYEVTITDTDGCLDSVSVTISEPEAITIALDNIQHESCTVGNDGQITISATGGAGGFGYAWSTSPVQTTPTANNLSAGSYTVSVTDANGCIKTESYTINPPTLPTIVDFTQVDVKCPSDNTGSLTVNVSAGNGQNFTYSWNTGPTTNSISNLSVGDYTVTVSDEYGCEASATATIVATEAFAIVLDTFIKPTCVGDADGSLVVEMAGSGNFQFEDGNWNASAGNTFILSGLSAGSYNVTITDLQSACPAIITSLTLPDPHAIETTITLQNGVSCFDGSILDGAATATAQYSDGVAGSFNFTWQPNITSCLGTTNCSSNNLGINENYLIVDDGTCTVYDTIIVGGPDSILVTNATVTPASCYQDSDGTISIEVQGGNPAYTYGWTGPAAGQNAANVNNLPAGNYTVLVTDMVGCSETFDFVIDEPEELQLLIDLTKTVNVYCFGESTGQIYVQPIGGNQGYTYNWSPDVGTDNIASFLEAGTYAVTVTDAKGCSASLTHVLTENPPIMATLNPIEDPECFGYQTVISIDTVIGGSGGPYTYSVDYSPPQSIQLDYQVFADSHFVLVYDAFECSTEIRIDIGEPDEIYLNLPATVEVELGDSIQLNPVYSSSLPIDTFYWTPTMYLRPDTVLHPFVVDLFEDQVYELTIIDVNGCSQTAEVLVEIDRNRNVYIPNIFSPNNDGFNDIFHPKTGIGVKEVTKMSIFDRWGNLIYNAKNFLPGDNSPYSWDGSFKGKALDPGVFVYMIEVEFLDGKVLLYRGAVTLMK